MACVDWRNAILVRYSGVISQFILLKSVIPKSLIWRVWGEACSILAPNSLGDADAASPVTTLGEPGV